MVIIWSPWKLILFKEVTIGKNIFFVVLWKNPINCQDAMGYYKVQFEMNPCFSICYSDETSAILWREIMQNIVQKWYKSLISISRYKIQTTEIASMAANFDSRDSFASFLCHWYCIYSAWNSTSCHL